MGGFYHLSMGGRGYSEVGDEPLHARLELSHTRMSDVGLAHIGRVPDYIRVQSVRTPGEVYGRRLGQVWTQYSGVWSDGKAVALGVFECLEDDAPYFGLLTRVSREVLSNVHDLGGRAYVYVRSEVKGRDFCLPWDLVAQKPTWTDLRSFDVTRLQHWGQLYE